MFGLPVDAWRMTISIGQRQALGHVMEKETPGVL
jgi:hypothetical protein